MSIVNNVAKGEMILRQEDRINVGGGTETSQFEVGPLVELTGTED